MVKKRFKIFQKILKIQLRYYFKKIILFFLTVYLRNHYSNLYNLLFIILKVSSN